MNFTKKIKFALVHDDFIQKGGAEKLLLEIAKELKNTKNFEIKIYSSLINNEWKEIFEKNEITFQESFLAKIPFCYKINKFFFFLNLYYLAFLDFDFSEYRYVFSSSTRYAHSIITKPGTYHISYLNSPFKALWESREYFFGKKFLYIFIKYFLPRKRILDFYSQQMSDLVISNSLNTQRKILKFYNRKSIVMYPFFEQSSNTSNVSKSDFYLLISRLVSWKRIDYVIETFNQNQLPLVIIGEGPEFKKLKQMSRDNITFTGYISEQEKNQYLNKANALIVPQNEDFGLVILEAINHFCPVLYLNSGGAKEIVSNKLGIGFSQPNNWSLSYALECLGQVELDLKHREKILNYTSPIKFTSFLLRLINHKMLVKSKDFV